MEENKLNKKIEKGIEDIKKAGMTSVEKARVLQNIFDSKSATKKPIQSPYTFISIFTSRHFIYSASSLCLIVILFSGTVFASGKSLPGNILYPLKVNVVEPVRGAFLTSPIAKVEYENNLATTRLVEAETLAKRGELDAPKEAEINALLEIHTKAFNQGIDNLRQNSKDDENKDDNSSDDIVTSFQATLNAHAQILNIINNKNQNNTTEENTDTQISKTAKDNAKKVRDNYKNKEENQNIKETTTEKKTSTENPQDVHEKLLDEESSKKESEILLKTGLNLHTGL